MKNVPNIITCLNLFAGCLACVMSLMYANYLGAFFFIVLAAVFDFLDGFAARLLKAYSPIGAQLDSLADVISFGLAPGCMIYAFLINLTINIPYGMGISIFAFIIPIFCALRLAKFNIDTRQTSSFLGLPVPATGLFWAALIPSIFPFAVDYPIITIISILILIIVFSLLMISEIPMFSLKFKHYKWEGNQWAYILIISAIILVAVFQVLGVSFTICLYILLSLIKNMKKTT